MLKFKITPTRFAEACNALEYLAVTGDNKTVAIRLIHRFLLDDDGKYVVRVTLDDDGDITAFERANEAMLKMQALTPKRLEKLAGELMEAAKAIVNPPSEGG